ncbi:MAG: hybrid sensor histidine kinase/response regulator [Aquabacterium sp.]
MTSPRVTCLLVDDVAENLVALRALLLRDDVDVLTARSGEEALELLLAHDVALALVDVQMPGMDGFELAELIRGSERTRHIPLIFVTAGTHDQHRLFKGYETGAVDFLYKPIDPHILNSKVNVFFDLYRQKRALAHELQERTETLRMNEMFMAVLGHDLRNPLSAIVHSAYVLQRDSSHSDATRKLVDRVLNSSHRMSRMIEDLLDVARARLGGGIHIERGDNDLGAIVLKAVQEHQTSCPERTITMQAIGDLAGRWDGDRLAQVASNLIANALHHGERQGPVELRLDGQQAGHVTLSVSNPGQIPASLLSHIFDPFRGSDRSSQRSEGLGLGLYIVRQIVLAHQGDIDVESNGITTFRMTLPRA